MLTRIVQLPIILFIVSLVVFGVLRVLPGDVVSTLTEGAQVSPEKRAQIEQALDLDESLPTQYWLWIKGVIRLDFGKSLQTGSSVSADIADRLPRTLELGALSVLVSTVVGVSSGIASALTRGTPVDYSIRLMSLLGLAVPLFFLQSVVRNYFFPVYLNWIPPVGYVELWEDPWRNLQQLWLPATLLGLAFAAYTSRLTRSAMLDVLQEDYIRTARAKGLHSRVVVGRHALRNAALPIMTLSGIQLGAMFGGAVITEQIFAIPGMGTYLVSGIRAKDYTVVQSGVLVSASLYLILNLAIDLAAAKVDPRVK